ncbi:MAG TPA: FG-GAP-like repeat-containing protein [Terriglobales bacterium]|nr:FG-GAP-like repeat-containing protein [Terriglobales bacterium]
MRRLSLPALFACVFLCAAASAPAAAAANPEAAVRANNRGVAYMDRSAFAQAAQEFTAALRLDPSLLEARTNLGIAYYAAGNDAAAEPVLEAALRHDSGDLRAHYVLGLIARNHGRYQAALDQFLYVVRREPRDKSANYFTGYTLLRLGRPADAIGYLNRALEADPNDVSALFNLANAYRAQHDMPRAMAYFKRFEQVRQSSPLNTAASLVYGDEGQLAMASATVPPGLRPAPRAQPVRFVDATAAAGVQFRSHTPTRFPGPGACAFDAEGDGRPDLFFVNGDGPPALYRNLGGGRFEDVTRAAGLEQPMHGLGCAVGDYDNDGRPDLLVTEAHHLLLFHNLGGGRFAEVAAQVGLAVPASAHPDFLAAAWIDLDHDGYLDIVVTDAAAGGRVHVFHNLGTGHFKDISASSRIGQSPASYQGLVATDFDNDRDIDVVLARANGPASIFSNLRNGAFAEVRPWAQAVTPLISGARAVLALDYNHDFWMDLFFTRIAGPPVLLGATGEKRFRPVPLPAANAGLSDGWGATALDYDNDGFADLAFIASRHGRQSLFLYRNLGDGTFADATAATGLDRIPLHDARTVLAVDWAGDGRPGLVVTQAGGPAILLRNVPSAAAAPNRFLKVKLEGLKDNKLGIGSKVTVRAAGLAQKTEVEGGSGYLGENPPAQLFGLGGSGPADSVTIRWPTGVLQAELPPAGQSSVHYVELNRKGGSCPVLYSWNGRRFQFIDDITGPGVIGEWTGPGQYDSPQPSECLRLPAGSVVPRHGRLEFRFTDGMEEVIYLDRVGLMAVDHPAGIEVFDNDRWQPDGPPPAFRLWAVAHAHPPLAATDESGRDLLPYLLPGHPGRYTPIAARSPFPGYVGLHTLTLDLGDLRQAHTAQLLLHGWTDYYFPDTAWTAFYAGIPTVPPALQLPDGHGGWRTVVNSVGAPAGLPRWMVIDLTPWLGPRGALARRDARLRLRTNLAIYWDRALVSVDPPQPPLRVEHLRAASATLRWLGFPDQVASSPEVYDYDKVLQDVGFRAPAGNYTRYGDVRDLLAATDDRYAIMAPGDEVAVGFDASALPPLPPGWQRTYFFCADAFTKGRDFLDAHPDTVGPLPLHGLPYPTPPHNPVSVALLRYRLEYNTRHLPAMNAAEKLVNERPKPLTEGAHGSLR